MTKRSRPRLAVGLGVLALLLAVALPADAGTRFGGAVQTIRDMFGGGVEIASPAQGAVTFFDGTNWTKLAAGNSGEFLKTQGAGANPVWAVSAGSNHALLSATHTDTTASTVTRGALIAGTGVSPTWSGLVLGAANSVIRSDGTDVGYGTLTSLLDSAFSSTQGAILHRGAAAWTALGPGTSGQVLQTGGAAANPSYVTNNRLFLALSSGQAVTPATSPAFPETRNNHAVLSYDAAADEDGIFESAVPANTIYVAANTITVDLYWVAATATTGNVKWNAQFENVDAGGHDLDADSFAAVQTGTGAANATSGIVTKTTITFTNAQADALSSATGSAFRLKVTRDGDDVADTMTGDAQLVRAVVEQR